MAGITASEGPSPDFPCDIPIKVFGRNVAEFRHAAVAIVRAHFAATGELRVAERLSRDGTYLSLTIVVRAETRAQADAVYRALSGDERVLIVL